MFRISNQIISSTLFDFKSIVLVMLISVLGACDFFAEDEAGDSIPSQRADSVLSNPSDALDRFGTSVDIDGDIGVVGAITYNDGNRETGGAHVFRRDTNGDWAYEVTLVSDTVTEFAQLGSSVAVVGDTIYVGAPRDGTVDIQNGAVLVFSYDSSIGGWERRQTVSPTFTQNSPWFGYALATDGTRLVVGVPTVSVGLAHVYTIGIDGTLQFEDALEPTPDDVDALAFGFGDALAVSGDTIVVGAPSQTTDSTQSVSFGAAYVYRLDDAGQTWNQEAQLEASDRAHNDEFGFAVAVSNDTVLIGAPERSIDGDNFPDGVVYRFARSQSGVWAEQVRITPPEPLAVATRFGTSVAIGDGFFVTGGPGAGSGFSTTGALFAYTFGDGTNDFVTRVFPIDAQANEGFGRSIAIDGTTAIIGSQLARFTGPPIVGSAHIWDYLR